MKQIYTKTGDEGTTSLRGGQRVAKDDVRIEANGQIDHLNALLGIVRTYRPDEMLKRIQAELMTVMSHIATPEGEVNPRQSNAEALTADMEQAIDRMTSGKTVGFVLPGEDSASAFAHLARTQARTVERRLWALNRQYAVDASVLKMMNRLSDYLFTLAL